MWIKKCKELFNIQDVKSDFEIDMANFRIFRFAPAYFFGLFENRWLQNGCWKPNGA